MRRYCLAAWLVMRLSWAQQIAPDVQDTDPVMSMAGLCSDGQISANACVTVITRLEFDRMCDALQPAMGVPQRLQFATQLAHDLRRAAAARQRGLDHAGGDLTKLSPAQLGELAWQFDQSIQDEAKRVTGQDMATWYAAHREEFFTAEFDRLFVPHVGRNPSATPEFMAQLADTMRARLVNGEPADDLQRQIFDAAGLPIAGGTTRLRNVRRDSLPPQHAAVMALQPGQVAPLLGDPQGARFIYRMISISEPDNNALRAEIVARMTAERMRHANLALLGADWFSDAYFNPPGQDGRTSTVSARAGRRAGQHTLAAQQRETGHGDQTGQP